jgi:hypothetical protein
MRRPIGPGEPVVSGARTLGGMVGLRPQCGMVGLRPEVGMVGLRPEVGMVGRIQQGQPWNGQRDG